MNKICIYPDDELYSAISKSAEKDGVSINTCVCDMLREILSIDSESQVIESEITKDIYDEIKDFISNAKDGEEFSLMEASKTFANTDYLYNFDAKNFRAKIGMSFAKQIKKNNIFNNVVPAYKDNGKRKLGKNNAVLYKVKK